MPSSPVPRQCTQTRPRMAAAGGRAVARLTSLDHLSLADLEVEGLAVARAVKRRAALVRHRVDDGAGVVHAQVRRVLRGEFLGAVLLAAFVALALVHIYRDALDGLARQRRGPLFLPAFVVVAHLLAGTLRQRGVERREREQRSRAPQMRRHRRSLVLRRRRTQNRGRLDFLHWRRCRSGAGI